MKISITSVLLTMSANFITAELPKDALKDVQQVNTFRTPQKDTTSPTTIQKGFHNLWNSKQAGDNSHYVLYKSPQSLTRLAKSLTFGVDPFFNKDYFEPFERRPKPSTLIAFRKNGLVSKQNVKIKESAEVAELQSPYNEISNFWQNEAGQF